MNYLPPTAIWFQRANGKHACVCVVNDMYQYRIYCPITGHEQDRGMEKTLPKAKKKVFEKLA